MPSQEDVNAQHLVAAGVDPASLGQPYSEPEPVPRKMARDDVTRCNSYWVVIPGEPPTRCSLLDGHENYHRNGPHTWVDAPKAIVQARYDEIVAEVERIRSRTAGSATSAVYVDTVLEMLGIEVDRGGA